MATSFANGEYGRMFENLHLKWDERGALFVSIDVLDRPMNVFDAGLLGELDRLIDDLQDAPGIGAVVFRSGKESGFLAGADVKQIAQIRTAQEADQVIVAGQDLFNKIASLPIPTIAVIHGPCLGGGLEFALACDYRIAEDTPSTRLGLPETQLGIIPAWGGTQRLPKQVGALQAVTMILQGRKLSAPDSLKCRLVDRIAPPAEFEHTLDELLDLLLNGETPRNPRGSLVEWLRDETSFGRGLIFRSARKRIEKNAKHYPALPAALRAIETGYESGIQDGLRVERDEFSHLIFSDTCKNLVGLFLQREQARKRATWVSNVQTPSQKVEKIAVLGAGTMGAGIAQAAAFSGFDVVLKDINDELVAGGRARIEKLMRSAAKKGVLSAPAAEERLARIQYTTSIDDLTDADLVIEAIVEKLNVKQDVFSELDKQLSPRAVLASNTSALSIEQIGSATKHPERVAGLHFFNPVYKMPLVEVVRSPATGDAAIRVLVDVVRQLGKVPLVVGEGPGFLVNRVLFPYMDEAVRMVSEGAEVTAIDRAAKKFGMPMGPLELLDVVGLDVARHVADTIGSLSPEPSPTPEFLQRLIDQGHLGKKSGRGFYLWKDGKRQQPVELDRPSGKARLPEPVTLKKETIDGYQQRLTFALINEASDCLESGIVSAAWMVDLGMVLGTGFAPFRGGPLRLADTWGIDATAKTLEDLETVCGERFRPSSLLLQLRESEDSFYDYNSKKSDSSVAASEGLKETQHI
ncbi:3-hydroxyacyl-CoA dehydrogenase NAD-binding domain-containing protein [Stratiformator vulcanicus]|uniref:enoyl-CoA hydratase n=1 Tax=Stratiformator vulcanicus TaxID=2527980 RepID=A0A517QVX1_9PLAN|nr:3-hydroxyacyl-CoA dehydrogenase NAD-binding domain-containing protein [Stratiformator vulcanicus]QDT35781.1 Fatty acid oxidation complex subunit alpha [Stratiformator vulcanicus]